MTAVFQFSFVDLIYIDRSILSSFFTSVPNSDNKLQPPSKNSSASFSGGSFGAVMQHGHG